MRLPRPAWRFSWRPDRRRILDDAFIVIAGVFVLLRLLSVPPWDQSVDAYAYHQAVGPGGPYAGAEAGTLGSYLYSPAFKLILGPAGWLPWPVFNAAWTALNLALLRALAGRYALPLLFFPPVFLEIVSGNVHLLTAAVVVWGFTRPALWAIPLLTKITPGVGIIWFAVRREWRSLAVAVGVTALVSAVSALVVPQWWLDWFRLLLASEPLPTDAPGWFVPISPWVRLPIAVVLVAWAALTGRRWAVPLAVTLAMPVIWLNSLAVLVAILPLAPPGALRAIRGGAASLVARLVEFGSRRPVQHGLIVACAVFVVVVVQSAASGDPFIGYDARAYWTAAALDDPYASTIAGGFGGEGGLYEYKYPPPLAQLLALVHWIPWPVFYGIWTAVLLAALALQAGRLLLVALFFPPVLGELWLGNVNLLIGLAIVLGFRWPAAWAFVILTKITPGIGLIWFAVRREWRSLGIAVAATATISAVSLALAPELWQDFVAALRTQEGVAMTAAAQAIPLPLTVRLAAAAALVVWGAAAGHRWVVPVAAIIASPFTWWNVLAMAVAVIPLTVPEATPRLAALLARRADGSAGRLLPETRLPDLPAGGTPDIPAGGVAGLPAGGTAGPQPPGDAPPLR